MQIDPGKVPSNLRAVIHLAEKFGIADDGYRLERIQQATPDEILLLKETIQQVDDYLDEWLAGPEADGEEFSDEYIAFSAMRMAADES